MELSDTCPMFRAMTAFPWFYNMKAQGFLCFGIIQQSEDIDNYHPS